MSGPTKGHKSYNGAQRRGVNRGFGKEKMDRSSETLDSIREINLSYLMLAQRMLREDKPVGMFRLGLSSELADLLSGLSLAQIVKLAASDQLLCSFRFDDHVMLSALTQTSRHADVAATHTAILLAGQSAVQFA
ncbi:flagellar transcriptional activator FlhD [Paraburkholderia sacchari]